jgi:hypothetical protein
MRRDFDASGVADSLDQFGTVAFDMITGARAKEAFDITQEQGATRERYGLHRWGQSCLLARRLVEAGVAFVTVNFDPHSYTFDMHGNIKGGMQNAGPRMDSAIAALVEDRISEAWTRESWSSPGANSAERPKSTDWAVEIIGAK